MYEKNKNKVIIIGIIFILILGFSLRIYKLDSKVIWYDEACSIASSQKAWGEFFTSYFNYKPFYFICLKIWTTFFGISPFVTRFLSVIFATLSIYLIYKVGRRLFSKEVGLYSAFLLSTSCFHIYHSQQVKQLILLTLLVLFSYFLCTEIFFSKVINKNLIFINSFINVLIIFTHPYALAIPISQNIFFLTQKKKFPKLVKSWYYGQVIIFLFILFWLFVPNQKNNIKEMTWWIPHFNFKLFLETFQTFAFGGPRYGLDDFRIENNFLYKIGNTLFFLYLWLFILPIILTRKKENKIKEEMMSKLIFLKIWLWCPIILAILVSIFLKPVYIIKHLIYTLPAFYLIISVGLSKIKEKALKHIILIIISIISIFPLYILYNNDFNIDWQSPSHFIKNNARDNDTIFIVNLEELVPFMYYFSIENKFIFKDIDIYGKNLYNKWNEVFLYGSHCIVGINHIKIQGDENKMIKEFNTKIAANQLGWLDNNIWLAVSRWTPAEVKAYIVKHFAKDYKFNKKICFRRIELLYFLKN